MQNKLQKQFLIHIKIDLPLELFILPSHSPTGPLLLLLLSRFSRVRLCVTA